MEEERELISIRPSDDNPEVVLWVKKGTTWQEVLEKALPHMGPDEEPFAPAVHHYGPDRFRNALVAAGYAVPDVQNYDLSLLVGFHGRFALDTQSALKSLLDTLPTETAVPA